MINVQTGQAILDFNNREFLKFSAYLLSQGYPAPQTEFDAATIELTTLPYYDLNAAFESLTLNIKAANHYLIEQKKLLLLLGLHPGRDKDALIMTNNSHCGASVLLMAEQGGPLFYCSYQINIGVAICDAEHLLTLCHGLQRYIWPCSVVTQSSPIFANRQTNYQSYRLRLNDAVSGCRSGSLPVDIHTIQEFQDYCSHLPDEAHRLNACNVWYDILPKLIVRADPSKGYRIEIRLADTTELKKLYAFTQAMYLTFSSILTQLKKNEPFKIIENRWLMLNRDSVLKKGREARVTDDGIEFYTIKDYLNLVWRPLVSKAAENFSIDIDTLILQLLENSRAESMVKKFSTMSTNEIAVYYAYRDYHLNA